MDYVSALNLARELEKKLRESAEVINIAGSIRRKKPQVKDIDYVVIPKEGFHDKVRETLNQIFSSGNKRIRGAYKGMNVDFFITNKEEIGAAMNWWTGPTDKNISNVKVAKRNGWKFSNLGLFDNKGNRLEVGEFAILKRLGKEKYSDPTKR
jgi:DNA polymerase (family 10)